MPKPVGPISNLTTQLVQDSTPPVPSNPAVATETRTPGPTDTSTRVRAADLGAGAGARARVGKAPDLLADWTDSVVRCAAEAQAVNQQLPEIQADVAKEIAASPTALDDDAQAELFEKVAAKHAEPLIPGFLKTITASPASVAAAVKAVTDGEAQRVAELRDPFTPIAMNDPAARARETVLWENRRLVVIVDAFVGAPKALVIPKARLTYPNEAPAALLTEMSQVALVVGQALTAAAATSAPLKAAIGTGPAKIWINPPPQLGVSQLHVHVLPELPAWKRAMPKEWAKAESKVAAAQDDPSLSDWTTRRLVNQEFQRAIARVVGPYYAAVTAELDGRPDLVALKKP